jgi:hypothetical protein
MENFLQNSIVFLGKILKNRNKISISDRNSITNIHDMIADSN